LLLSFKERASGAQRAWEARKAELTERRSGFAYETHLDSMKKNLRNLMGSQNCSSLERIVQGLESVAGEKEGASMLCDLLYEALRCEHRETPLLSEQSDNQPAITRKQQRLFTLLTVLDSGKFPGIVLRMAELIWHGFFTKDRMYHLKLNAVLALGRVLVLCLRYTDSLQLARTFLYDLFFFKSPRNHLLVGCMVALWPEAFPHSGQAEAAEPLVQSLVWAVLNTGPTISSEMLVQTTRDNFIREYGYKQHGVKAEDLVVQFIARAKDSKCGNKEREALTKGLLLLGRLKEYQWANNNICSRLLQCLAEVWQGGGNDALLCWVLPTIGLVSRLYPVESRQQLLQFLDPVHTMLRSETRKQEVEAACVRAMVYLGYHLQLQVAMFLKEWTPKFQLDQDLRILLEDFVGTRSRKFADKTVQIARQESIRERKRRGVKR